jgi:hypothetical protein
MTSWRQVLLQDTSTMVIGSAVAAYTEVRSLWSNDDERSLIAERNRKILVCFLDARPLLSCVG